MTQEVRFKMSEGGHNGQTLFLDCRVSALPGQQLPCVEGNRSVDILVVSLTEHNSQSSLRGIRLQDKLLLLVS